MKVFITGANGFIGKHVVKKLVSRGHEVWGLVRDEERAAEIRCPGVRLVTGDILRPETFIPAMRDAGVVYHLAAWYKVGTSQQEQAEPTNVGGTRNILEAAFELHIPRIIYTSSIGIYGDTQGAFHTEELLKPEQQFFLTEYDRTKWLAHYKVALPLITKGAPITIVIPGVAYGPGDPSLIGDLMRAFQKGWLVFFPAPETMHCFTHVEDVAEGIILAAEKGRLGESYILAGRPLAFWQAAKLWAIYAKRPAPRVFIPSRFLNSLEGLARIMRNIVPLPNLLSPDGARLAGATYLAYAEKARKELGWNSRSVEVGFKETFDWIRKNR
jgi:dihydroflavonol-4-reductase